MLQEYEATVMVVPGGRVELVAPDAPPGSRVRAAVRRVDDAGWLGRLAAASLRGPSLPDEALRRESIYADDAP